MSRFRKIFLVTLFASICGSLNAATIYVVIASNAAPRVEFGAEKFGLSCEFMSSWSSADRRWTNIP